MDGDDSVEPEGSVVPVGVDSLDPFGGGCLDVAGEPDSHQSAAALFGAAVLDGLELGAGAQDASVDSDFVLDCPARRCWAGGGLAASSQWVSLPSVA